jgi:hypothetical protein
MPAPPIAGRAGGDQRNAGHQSGPDDSSLGAAKQGIQPHRHAGGNGTAACAEQPPEDGHGGCGDDRNVEAGDARI